MNVSLQQLKVFVAVARERSFTRAAYDGHTGVVVFASNPVMSSNWVPQALAQCAAAFPGLVVSVKDQSQSAVLASVEHGEVDFGAVCVAESINHPLLHAQVLFTTPLHAVMPATHPLAQHDCIERRALREWPLITLNADTGVRAALEPVLAASDLKHQEVGHVAAVARMVELGLGVGILPVDSHWPLPGAAVVSRPLHPGMTLTTVLVHRRNRSLSPNAAAVWTQFVASKDACAHANRSLLQEP